jgi:hypothetical protein
MKYTVKTIIFKQENVNANQKDKDGNPLPEQIESVQSYQAVSDLLTSGSTKLTATAIKTEMRTQLSISDAVSESLTSPSGVEYPVSGSISDRKVVYTVTLPPTVYPEPITPAADPIVTPEPEPVVTPDPVVTSEPTPDPVVTPDPTPTGSVSGSSI